MNDESSTTNQVQERILSAIANGRLCVRPRWHFVLKTILSILGLIILFLTGIYLASFILFALRYSGVSSVPAFGPRGWYAFLVGLPWMLIVFLLLFIGVLEVLVRRYAFSYRRPFLYSALAIIVFVMSAGYVVAMTPLHTHMFRYMEQHELPVAGRVYKHYGHPPMRMVHPGDIVMLTESGFLLHTPRNEKITIVITRKTRLPFGSDFVPGDHVVVFGERHGMVVDAFGVREIARDR